MGDGLAGRRVLINGAAGFVGQGLAAALSRAGCDLILADRAAGPGPGRWIAGDLSDPAHLADLAATRPDIVFHLASLPGARAETDAAAGWAVNLLAPQTLFAALAALGTVPRVVFASSIAVLGAAGPGPVTDDTPPAPTLSYGAHKWMAEILLADLSRRGELDGISLRLPGIVARPPTDSGHGSAFMSQIFHHAAAGTAYAPPVMPQARCWWMARPTLIANLPVLVATVGAVLRALEARHGPGATAGIRPAPDARIEAIFGRQPPLDTPRARALGLVADADTDSLVAQVLADRPG
jgi:nucleoside-diphosphate-sugar epimerase